MTEVRARPDSGFPGPPDSAIYVECFVPADRIRAALDLAAEALSREGYELIDVDRCLRFDLDEWDYERYHETSQAREVAERVIARGKVEFGPFCFSGPDS
jgi:hypothetical protein